jgi:hypothetical protein
MRKVQPETAIVLVADAAKMLGFSVSAIREWRRMGMLDATELDGRHAVMLRSVRELAVEFEAKRPRQRGTEARNEPKHRHLRLVVDNS